MSHNLLWILGFTQNKLRRLTHAGAFIMRLCALVDKAIQYQGFVIKKSNKPIKQERHDK